MVSIPRSSDVYFHIFILKLIETVIIVLLRGIMPHSKEYEITHLIDDITEIGQNVLFGNQSFEKKFNDFFQDMGMDFDAL